jgi:hypothetical protein
MVGVISLSEIKNISSYSTRECADVLPALGALCYTYAKNLSWMGCADSESVIMLHQLFGSELHKSGTTYASPVIIGQYLGPRDIGQILGAVHLRQGGTTDDKQFIRAIKKILQQVTTRNIRNIKESIIDNLKSIIARDTELYLTQEKELIDSYQQEDRKEFKASLKSLAHSWNGGSEAFIMNKLNVHQKNLLSALKNLHKKIAKNRYLLDTELQSLSLENPLFKDSMSAFTYGLAGSLKEEGLIYPPHNTMNLLLAFLWHKATHRTDLFDAIQAYAKSIGCACDIMQDTGAPHYTDKDVKRLREIPEDAVPKLSLEDLIYMYHCMSPSDACRLTYFNGIMRVFKEPDAKYANTFAVPYLVALYASDWQLIDTLPSVVMYCRCLMHPLDDPYDRLALMRDISQGRINSAGMVTYYICALKQLYQSLPVTYDIQKQAFDIIALASLHGQSRAQSLDMPRFFLDLIKQVYAKDARAALACTLLDYIHADQKLFDEQHNFDVRAYVVHTLGLLKNDMLKSLCITHIMRLVARKDFDEKFAADLTQRVSDMLATIDCKDGCYHIILTLLTVAPEIDGNRELFKVLYTWSHGQLDRMDDFQKSMLVGVILDQCKTRTYPANKHGRRLLSQVTRNVLPSIRTQEVITGIVEKIVPCLSKECDIDIEFFTELCHWIRDKLPKIDDETKKVKILLALLERLDTYNVKDDRCKTCVIMTIECVLQSIHQVESKIALMNAILSSGEQSAEWKELYDIMYQWMEMNIPHIGNAVLLEDLLSKLLHRIQAKHPINQANFNAP